MHSVAADAPPAPEVPEVKDETVLCYQVISNLGKPWQSMTHSYIRVVSRGVSGVVGGGGTCLELAANGQLRSVPGECHPPKLADVPCAEKP